MRSSSSTRRLAIVAHFDPHGMASSHFLLLLEDLRAAADQIIIVSTNLKQDQAQVIASFGMVLIRSNTGYDFASWRFGLEYARRHFVWSSFEEIILLNDSFFLLRKNALANVFDKVRLKDQNIVALVSSHQVRFHLMSFFLVFRRTAFLSLWFDQFWSSIWDYGDRDFVIWHYELDLAAQAISHGLSAGALFDPMIHPAVTADQKLTNPAHVHWDLLAKEHGIAKIELVRSNPLGKDLGELQTFASPEHWQAITEYLTQHPALSFFSSPSPIEECREYACMSEARIAVHVHLHDLSMLDDVLRYTRNVPPPSDIFVTTPIKDQLHFIIKAFKAQNRHARVIPMDDAGQDVLPLFALIKAGVFAPYAAACEIQSRAHAETRDHHNPMTSPMRLLGSSRQALEIMAAFKADPSLGIVTANHLITEPQHVQNPPPLKEGLRDDQMGPMYWFRPSAFSAVSEVTLSAEDGALSDIHPKGGTHRHSIDEFILEIVHASGYTLKSVDQINTAPLEKIRSDSR